MSKKRFLVKLSGEVLKGPLPFGISWDIVDSFCAKIAGIVNKTGAELGLVIGGGNIFRGASGTLDNYNRSIGDQMGMMATVVNGLALVERLKANGLDAIMQSGVKIDGVADLFNIDKVNEHFSKGGIVVFAGGIGNPYFSTDTTSALRALQINADCLFKATKVDGIYDKDPFKHQDAKRYDEITYNQIIDMRLQIMDLTAMQLLSTNKMKLMVFNMMNFEELELACRGGKVGTLVKE